MSSFRTKRNNGTYPHGYSNQCMWLSILDYLRDILSNTYNLDWIRMIASQNAIINSETEPFDVAYHFDGLLNVIKTFNLQIHMYVSFNDASGELVISEKPDWIIGELSSPNVVSIVSYGFHFELITSIGTKSLYGNLPSNSSHPSHSDVFIPDRNLATGKILVSFTELQLKDIDEKLNGLSCIIKQIYELENTIKMTKLELVDSDKKFYSTDLSSQELEIQEAIVMSIQIYQQTLRKKIEENEKTLEETKATYEFLQKELNDYLSM